MVSQLRIETLARWEQEYPELAAIDWREVICALTLCLWIRCHVALDELILRCGKTSEELAIEVCGDFILGKISWNRPYAPTTAGAIAFLRPVLRRDYLDAAFIKKKGKRVRREEVSLDAVPAREVFQEPASPERACIDRDGSGVIGRLYELLEESPDGHPKFLSYVNLLHENANIKPRDAARELNVSITVIHQMRKRLERRLRLVVPHSMLEGRPRYRRRQGGQHG